MGRLVCVLGFRGECGVFVPSCWVVSWQTAREKVGSIGLLPFFLWFPFLLFPFTLLILCMNVHRGGVTRCLVTFFEIISSKAHGNLGMWPSYVIHMKFILAREFLLFLFVGIGSLFVSIGVVVYVDCGFKTFSFLFRI